MKPKESLPIPVTPRSTVWVCGLSFAEIVGSNPAGAWKFVSFEFCVLSGRSGWSLVQRSPTECGVSECDRESSIMRRPWPTGTVASWLKKPLHCSKEPTTLIRSQIYQIHNIPPYSFEININIILPIIGNRFTFFYAYNPFALYLNPKMVHNATLYIMSRTLSKVTS
jgi:hypothetical protein